MPGEDKKKCGTTCEGRHSTVELLSKMFPERTMDDIHVCLEKHGGDVEATAWEMLAERGVLGPCHHNKAGQGGNYAKELTHAHHPTY